MLVVKRLGAKSTQDLIDPTNHGCSVENCPMTGGDFSACPVDGCGMKGGNALSLRQKLDDRSRGYSILEAIEVRASGTKSDQRVITGTATTPTPDRMDDIIEPLGVKFKNPMPLLWQHRSDSPVGTVEFDRPTKSGIKFTASLPVVEEAGNLKARIDEAWQSLTLGLVRAVSIGFRALEYSWMESGGVRFIQTEVMELSLVTIPANAEATISSIKSFDRKFIAATRPKKFVVVRNIAAGVSAPTTQRS